MTAVVNSWNGLRLAVTRNKDWEMGSGVPRIFIW